MAADPPPPDPPRTPSGTAAVHVARLGQRVIAEVCRATGRQAARLGAYGRAVALRWALRRRVRAAERSLGEAAFAAGAGDRELLDRVASLDARIRQALAEKRPAGPLESARREALLGLARDAFGRTPPDAGVAAAVKSVAGAREAARRQEARVASLRAELPPRGRAEWARVGVGYGVAAGVVLLAVALTAGGHAARKPTQTLTHRGVVAREPPAADTSVTHPVVTPPDPVLRFAPALPAPPAPGLGDRRTDVAANRRARDEIPGTRPAGVAVAAPEVRPAGAAPNPSAGDGPPSGEGVGPPEDLRRLMAAAGFDEEADWRWHLQPYVRFGSKASADAYARGDQFDRIEITRASAGHREELRRKRLRVGGLKFRFVSRNGVEERGLVAELALPLRVRGVRPFGRDEANFHGSLRRMHPSEVDVMRYAFLTKNGTLRPCTAAEALAVTRGDGVLYHPEVGVTTLALVFEGALDKLKAIARGAKDYSVELELAGLAWERPATWGYFRRDAYAEGDRDCERLAIASDLFDGDNPQPAYFVSRSGDEDRVPEIVRATLRSLRVLDKDGAAVGAYGERPAGRPVGRIFRPSGAGGSTSPAGAGGDPAVRGVSPGTGLP